MVYWSFPVPTAVAGRNCGGDFSSFVQVSQMVSVKIDTLRSVPVTVCILRNVEGVFFLSLLVCGLYLNNHMGYAKNIFGEEQPPACTVRNTTFGIVFCRFLSTS